LGYNSLPLTTKALHIFFVALHFAGGVPLVVEGVENVGDVQHCHTSSKGSKTFMWILNAVEGIAFRIVQERKVALSERLSQPPKHL